MGSSVIYDTTCREQWKANFGTPWKDGAGREVSVGEPVQAGTCWWGILSLDGEPECVALAVLQGPQDPDARGTVSVRVDVEKCGPTWFNCPLSLLEATPEPPPGSFSAKWRTRVREGHAAG